MATALRACGESTVQIDPIKMASRTPSTATAEQEYRSNDTATEDDDHDQDARQAVAAATASRAGRHAMWRHVNHLADLTSCRLRTGLTLP
jgi:hypothetical protein